MKNRRWIQWPSRFAHELNGMSGLAGLGGIALSGAGLTFIGGPVLIGLGCVLIAGATGYAGLRSYPPATLRPAQIVGSVVSIDVLDQVDPPLKRLAIIGLSQSGKTTLRNGLSFNFSPIERTQQLSAYIAAMGTSPEKYLAILDGSGDRYVQQFELAEQSDYLCIIVDHNESDISSNVRTKRLDQHRQFMTQARHHLNEIGAKPKLWIQILVNKHDLWQKTGVKQQKMMTNFGLLEIEKWRHGNYTADAEARAHSNEARRDVAIFMDKLKR